MKIILSRKGFDSSSGGVPSPVLPDGRIVSLPIPDEKFGTPANLALAGDTSIGELLENLCQKRYSADTKVHVDPDLERETFQRQAGWLPAFGQDGGAQTHLASLGVGKGDLFLFFGWFRHAEQIDGRWRYVKGGSDFHSLFGWLHVGDVINVHRNWSQIPDWLKYHPHFEVGGGSSVNNTIYVATSERDPNINTAPFSGGGMLKRWSPDLQLTAPESTRSVWQLPAWFQPADGRHSLSHHGNQARWDPKGEHVILKSVYRGQEFVLDSSHYPESISWAQNLINNHG